jgi:uridine phosphorylase
MYKRFFRVRKAVLMFTTGIGSADSAHLINFLDRIGRLAEKIDWIRIGSVDSLKTWIRSEASQKN